MKEEKEELKEMPAESRDHSPQPEVCVPYLPSAPLENKLHHEGIFSHFKVPLQDTQIQQKKALGKLLSFSKSASIKSCDLVKAMPHLCNPRKPMTKVIHNMEMMCIIENQQHYIVSLSVLRQLSQRKCTKCENKVSPIDSSVFFFLFILRNSFK
jgi:hypothetical protein